MDPPNNQFYNAWGGSPAAAAQGEGGQPGPSPGNPGGGAYGLGLGMAASPGLAGRSLADVFSNDDSAAGSQGGSPKRAAAGGEAGDDSGGGGVRSRPGSARPGSARLSRTESQLSAAVDQDQPGVVPTENGVPSADGLAGDFGGMAIQGGDGGGAGEGGAG